MQRSYFLGGSGPNGFRTAFWQEQQGFYGYYLKGGPGTGKSTLMKKLAAAFAGEEISVYHCASDPHSLDAVVFEERGVFVADATAPHESSTPLPHITGELVDLAAGLSGAALRESAGEITALYAQNQSLHTQARKGFAGIGAMEDLIAGIGAAALDEEKLTGFGKRFAKRLLPKKTGTPGAVLHRQCAAVTPLGELTLIPEQYDRILLLDPYAAASASLLRQLAEAAAHAGLRAELTVSLTRQRAAETHLVLPALQTMISAADRIPEDAASPLSIIRMQRFYDPAVLRTQRELRRFCSKTADSARSQTVALLAEALRVHDALERFYIAALDTAFLNRQAAGMIAGILMHPQHLPD